MRRTNRNGWFLAGFTILWLGCCASAQAQSSPENQERPALEGEAPPARVKPWRFFWEDGLSVGICLDLNPRSKDVIFYPHLSTIYIVGPEFGINARTAGSHYFALGFAKNSWIVDPLVRVSYGQQSGGGFIEIGMLFLPAVSDDSTAIWEGPRVIPRIVFGARF